MVKVQNYDCTVTKEKSSWRRVLPYMCAHNHTPFFKNMSFAVTNPLESHFCHKEWSTNRFKPTFKWRFLFVIYMVQWTNNVTWFSSTLSCPSSKTNPSSNLGPLLRIVAWQSWHFIHILQHKKKTTFLSRRIYHIKEPNANFQLGMGRRWWMGYGHCTPMYHTEASFSSFLSSIGQVSINYVRERGPYSLSISCPTSREL